MTVFAAFVRRGREDSCDHGAAARIGAFLQDEGLATVTISDDLIPLAGPWHRNQARMLRESAVAFANYVSEHPVDTAYALLPEYLGGRRAFGGIHGYIVDTDNRVAYVFLQSSHWRIFQDVNSKTVDDCAEILIRVLRKDLVPY
ncbi:MAG: hypothetical protein JSU63_18020 [Phycisphaerales bacterium]|nr:MAG: hypothetical protein JSU63_18020 [Phycisphaerales bacterium]